MTTIPYRRALATDYFHVRDQFTDEEWDRFLATRRFVDEEVLPVINDYWEAAELPWPLMRRLAELGLFEPMGPLADGPRPHGAAPRRRQPRHVLRRPVRARDEVDRAARLRGAEAALAARDCATLDKIGAFALTEPDHGSDSVALETTARRDGDVWIIDGDKRWIGNGSIADVTVVWARDIADGQVKGFLVETGEPGYQADDDDRQGRRARDLAGRTSRCDGVRVPSATGSRRATSFKDAGRVLVTHPRHVRLGRARPRRRRLRRRAHLRQAARAVRQARSSSFQLVQDRLVKMLADVTGMQLYCMQLARLEEAGQMTDTIAGLAKLNNTRTARRVIAEARDLLGGNGVLLENHVIRHMTDIEVIHTYEGTETMQALIVGRDITGIGAFK